MQALTNSCLAQAQGLPVAVCKRHHGDASTSTFQRFSSGHLTCIRTFF